MSVATITPSQLASKIQAGESIELIDVRTPVEYREVHLTIARSVPLDQLNCSSLISQRAGSAPLYVICQAGSRGRTACEKFHAAGYTNVINVEGGTKACVEAGLPVVRGRKAISLERQVRIAAGFLVLSGVVLGRFVHPWFVGVSGFVGAGLMFAGITDTCGMALVLARMPWNQVSSSGPGCAT